VAYQALKEFDGHAKVKKKLEEERDLAQLEV